MLRARPEARSRTKTPPRRRRNSRTSPESGLGSVWEADSARPDATRLALISTSGTPPKIIEVSDAVGVLKHVDANLNVDDLKRLLQGVKFQIDQIANSGTVAVPQDLQKIWTEAGKSYGALNNAFDGKLGGSPCEGLADRTQRQIQEQITRFEVVIEQVRLELRRKVGGLRRS